MEDNIIFSERQRFRQWWIWLILLIVNALCLAGVYRQIILERPIGPKPASDAELLIPAGLTILITILFYFLRLETIIKSDGIYIRFFPFHFSYKFYSWENLAKTFVRKYSPIIEYGGWGIRIGIFGKGIAYNVSGNKGLQLVSTNDKRILIGTNKPDELTAAIRDKYFPGRKKKNISGFFVESQSFRILPKASLSASVQAEYRLTLNALKMRNKIGIQNYFLIYVILMIVWTLLHINDIFGPSKGMASYIRNFQLVAILLNFLLLTAIHIFEIRMNLTYLIVLPIVIHAISSLCTYLFLFVFNIFHLTDVVAFFYLTITVMATLVTLKRTLRTFA